MQKKDTLTKLRYFSDTSEFSIGKVTVGCILEVTESGQAIVDYPGNYLGQVMARSVLTTPILDHSDVLHNQNVVLTFENGDPSLPIIIGMLHDELYITENEIKKIDIEKPRDVIFDGERLIFDAKKEVVLRCGSGSITLMADGKVIIKGTKILSRASQTNKIKGANVNIN